MLSLGAHESSKKYNYHFMLEESAYSLKENGSSLIPKVWETSLSKVMQS